MRMFRKLFCLMMALMFLLSVNLTAFAATYENVSDFSQLETAFNDNSGEDVSIDIVSDIQFDHDLTAREGLTFSIGSQNGSSLINAEFYGEGTVIIGTEENNMDVIGTDSVVALSAFGDVSVTVYGNVIGTDGDPGSVDFDEFWSYSDGSDGVITEGNASVTVTGNVTGGNSYGNYGFGGDGVIAFQNSTVTVGGNVTGGNNTANPELENSNFNRGGHGVNMDNSASVFVGGNVTGGSNNGYLGESGQGAYISFVHYSTDGSLTVGGSVTGGEFTGNTGTDGYGLFCDNHLDLDNTSIPSMTVGAYSSVGGRRLTEEELAMIEDSIVVTGLPDAEGDAFWYNVVKQIQEAEKGTEVTVDAQWRTTMPAFVMEAVRESGVILIIQWNGGEEIVIKEAPAEDASWVYDLSELAEM